MELVFALNECTISGLFANLVIKTEQAKDIFDMDVEETLFL
jgi:hypothetical protein